MNTIERFISNTLTAFTGELTAAQTIHKLEKEIHDLHQWLLNNEPGSQTWNQKREAMLRKIDNLNEIKETNN